MKDIIDVVQLLPESVQHNVMDFHDCTLKDGWEAVRVTLTRLLTDEEASQMQDKHFVGVGCTAKLRYAPEIQKSYFYVV